MSEAGGGGRPAGDARGRWRPCVFLSSLPAPAPTHTHRSARRGPSDERGGTPHSVWREERGDGGEGGEGAAPKKKNAGSEVTLFSSFLSKEPIAEKTWFSHTHKNARRPTPSRSGGTAPQEGGEGGGGGKWFRFSSLLFTPTPPRPPAPPSVNNVHGHRPLRKHGVGMRTPWKSW